MQIDGLTAGYVDCQIVVATNDGPDDDTDFDTIAPSGWVYLKPRRNAYTGGTPEAIVVPDTISLAIDSDGWATVPDQDGQPTDERKIQVPAVKNMTWTASFDITIPAYPWQDAAEYNRVKIKPFDIPVEDGKTTHIADYLPLGVDANTGETWRKGDRGIGIKSVETDGETATFILEDGTELEPIDLPASTVPGPPGPETDITIGDVTTSEDGDAAASISGEAPDLTLDLTLPRGPKGNDGAGIPSGGDAGDVPVRTSDGGTRWEPVLDQIGDNEIAESMLQQIGTGKLKDKAVTTAKIADKAVTPEKLDDDTRELIESAKPTQADLVSKLEAPVIIAHRGGGKNVYPEQGLRGMVASAESGFLPEFDIQFLKDGTPVLCHDDTADRTMTGVTGNVSSLSKEEWRNARLKAVMNGGRDDRPLLLEDVLDYLGGRIVLVPEIKRSATMDQVDTVIDLIVERGLERAVLMQSFDFDACKRLAEAGMEVVYLHGTGPSISWETVKEAGVKYWGPNRNNASKEKMDEAASAGIRVVPYTVEEPWHAEDLPSSVFGYFSNDPWGDSGRFGAYGTPRWEVGEAWPARRNTDEDSNKNPSNWNGPEIWGNGLYIPKPNRLASISLEHVSGGFVSPPLRIETTFRFLDDFSSATGNVGFHLIRNDNDDSTLFADKAVAGQQGYTIGLRRNGTLDAWEFVDGKAASKIGTDKGDAITFVGDESGSITLTAELKDNELTVTCPTNGASVTADGSVSGDLRPYLRINSTSALFEAVAVR